MRILKERPVTSKGDQAKIDSDVAEFLAKGGTVTKCKIEVRPVTLTQSHRQHILAN